jgi:hypothetical protein
MATGSPRRVPKSQCKVHALELFRQEEAVAVAATRLPAARRDRGDGLKATRITISSRR